MRVEVSQLIRTFSRVRLRVDTQGCHDTHAAIKSVYDRTSATRAKDLRLTVRMWIRSHIQFYRVGVGTRGVTLIDLGSISFLVVNLFKDGPVWIAAMSHMADSCCWLKTTIIQQALRACRHARSRMLCEEARGSEGKRPD